MTTPIEEKIAKLLAMAEGTTNPHEAETFMAKAEELMLQHGIERAQLEAQESKVRGGARVEDIVLERIPVMNGNGMAKALVSLAHNIGPSFSVRVLQSSGLKRGGMMVWFIGHRSDVEDVKTLFASLSAQAVAQSKAWWRTEGKAVTVSIPGDDSAYLARREFIFAFGRGAGERLRETRNRVVAEAGTGTELVLVDRKKAVESWVDQNITFGKARASRGMAGGGFAARQAGHAAGRDSVSGKALGR